MEIPAPSKTTEREILEFCNSRFGVKDMNGMAAKLAEECGETCGALVKIQEERATFDDLEAEVGDVLIVLSQIAANRGTTLEGLRAKRFLQIKERAKR